MGVVSRRRQEATLRLDGKSALNSASLEWDPHCQKRDFDILWEARKQLAALPIARCHLSMG
jgi:hypothetical protein